jgi:hypothetical protein
MQAIGRFPLSRIGGELRFVFRKPRHIIRVVLVGIYFTFIRFFISYLEFVGRRLIIFLPRIVKNLQLFLEAISR